MVRSIQFIDNYFPVIDGVTETVHHYAQGMDAAVVCPEMERHYLQGYSFPYRVLTSKTVRVPFPGMPALCRCWTGNCRIRSRRKTRRFSISTARA